MTKMNGTNIPNMTEQENLSVDEIFNENLIVKRKKTNFEDNISIESVINNTYEPTNIKFNNNNDLKLADKTIEINDKRKTAKINSNENNLTNNRISMETHNDLTKTIRLELRHANKCTIEYKTNNRELNDKNARNEMSTVLGLENGELHEYSLKHNNDLRLEADDKNINNDVQVQSDSSEFVNGNNTHDDKSGLRGSVAYAMVFLYDSSRNLKNAYGRCINGQKPTKTGDVTARDSPF
ncbi:unnamed protein product [Parnassius apollo]|uniref:(apollo) hypothetical protein n=1 Tax=Parnassius apollo TaxID=110799 RepID=A0A8S3Y8Z6_PARAO|nr:unnamed protein product [Parnassius apollo]